jgi:4-amino-4-deoxy-L-arabinose transferase-like glycosyltransferase
MKMGKLKKHEVIASAVLFALTFGLSGYWIVANPQKPLPDPTLYEGIGANLAEGNGYSFDDSPPYRPELTRTPFVPVLWMNAVFIGLAVSIAYLTARELFKDRKAALAGGIIAFLTPPVTGSANNILTEPSAMLLIAVIAKLLLTWPKMRQTRMGPLFAALLGLLLACLVLDRTSMTPVALIAATYITVSGLWGKWRSATAWISTVVLTATLGAPVLSWSKRNASLGLPFSPAPIGMYASRIFDMKRYKEHLLEPRQKLPAINKRYFLHWKRRYGPDELFKLEKENKEWFEKWYAEHSDRVWKSMPYRLIGLFSFFRNSIYPPWPHEKDQEMREKMRWVSRALWLLSIAGLALSWRNRQARWIWLGLVCPLVVVHMLTVCHSRYMFPLLPLLMPYGGVTIIWIWNKIFGLVKRSS